MAKKALLMILDGWGIGNHTKSDVIYSTPTPYWDYLLKTYPHSELQASGENVGLPPFRKILKSCRHSPTPATTAKPSISWV